MGSTVTVEPWGGGAALYVKAHAGAKRDRVAGSHDGMLKVEVTTAPEKGKANKAIAKLLAKALAVPASDIELLSGGTSQRKKFALATMTAEILEARIAALLSGEL